MTQTIQQMRDTLQSKIDKLTADVAAETQTDQAIVALLHGVVASNADIRQQLADAIAAGGDASVLQPIADALDAQSQTIEANTAALAAAVTANTPAAPAAT